MKKRLIGVWLLALLCISVFSGCADSRSKPYQEDLQKIEQVGALPSIFRQIVADNAFSGVTAFEKVLLKTVPIDGDEENRTVTNQILMMDLYGKTLAAYTCLSDDAYHISTLTATDDGGFLFVLGFSDYAYDQDTWASDRGFASRIIKCDRSGNLRFDTPLDGIEGRALRYCFEKDRKFYFFGIAETPETKIRGVGSPTDIYMAIIDEHGSVLKSNRIAGSDYDSLDNVEVSGDGFVLSIRSQSDDGDFTGSKSNGYPTDWVFTVDENLETISQKKEAGRAYSDYRLGEKAGEPVYKSSPLLSGFDAGTPEAVIDYGDFYLIVSTNNTGIYENTPLAVSSIWYYRETVYSAFDSSGKLLFRASVDSSPDYDALVAQFFAAADANA